jgi:hypothetical protein
MKYIALFVVLLLSFGCVGNELGGLEEPRAYGGNALQAEGSSYALKSISDSGSGQYMTQESYIRLKVAEGSLEDSFNLIKGNLSAQGGELTDIKYSEYSDRKQYTATVKVAPSKFDRVNEMLKGFGEVKDMSVSLEDVTKKYTDLDTRINNKENELTRLNELYNMSESVGEILEVERELTRVETELELLKSQKESLSSMIAKSTISVSVYEEKAATQSLRLQLEGLAGIFFGAVAAAITLIVVAVGFLLPIGVMAGALWFGYRFLTKPRKPSASRSRPQQ